MRPGEKLVLLRTLLERGAEVRTFYRDRRVVTVEQVSERYVVIRYEDGGAGKLYIADFGRWRFVAVI